MADFWSVHSLAERFDFVVDAEDAFPTLENACSLGSHAVRYLPRIQAAVYLRDLQPRLHLHVFVLPVFGADDLSRPRALPFLALDDHISFNVCHHFVHC